MADLIGNEEELNLLRLENQALRERVDLLEKTTRVQEETISLLREQIGPWQPDAALFRAILPSTEELAEEK